VPVGGPGAAAHDVGGAGGLPACPQARAAGLVLRSGGRHLRSSAPRRGSGSPNPVESGQHMGDAPPGRWRFPLWKTASKRAGAQDRLCGGRLWEETVLPATISGWRQVSAVADIIELIMADHDRIRRLLGAVDDAARCQSQPWADWPLAPVWRRCAELIELHGAAEEEICYLPAAGTGAGAVARIREAVDDHDDIREAIAEASLHRVGSPPWWLAVSAAGQAALAHLVWEERELLGPFAARATPRIREDLGQDWVQFVAVWGVTGRAGDADPGPLSGRRGDPRPPCGPSGYGLGRTG
jgi:hypothetical protein